MNFGELKPDQVFIFMIIFFVNIFIERLDI